MYKYFQNLFLSFNLQKSAPNLIVENIVSNKGGISKCLPHATILPFLAQRLFLIQISWNSKSVLSLGSYTWKNGQIRSAGRTVRQNRRFSGDCFFHVLDHLGVDLEICFSAKIFAQKNLEKFRDLLQEHLSPLPGRNETIMSSW